MDSIKENTGFGLEKLRDSKRQKQMV